MRSAVLRRLAGASMAAVAVIIPAPAASAAGSAPPACSQWELPVSWAPGESNTMTVAGRLCVPTGRSATALQLLVHGITYNHNYWDPGPEFAANSYVDAAAEAGYATLAIDRIGYGASTRPPSVSINYENQAWQLHQIIGYARDGRLGTAFAKVVFVAHSSGTGLAWAEAKYHDVDALIATGMAHGVAPLGTALNAPNLMQPAMLDPQLAAAVGIDAGYLTTAPGSRGRLFQAPDVDPALVAFDEQTKDTYTPTELTTGLATIYSLSSWDVNVPVLAVIGENDILICGTLATDCSSPQGIRAHEAPYYRPGLRLDTYVLPGAGHSINFARNAGLWFREAQDWVDAVLGG